MAVHDDPRAVVRDLLDALDAEPAFQDAMPRLAEGLGRRLGWDAVAIWMLQPARDRLRCAAVWSHDPGESKEFERLCRDTSYGEGEGLPGRAWRSRVPIWSNDPAEDGRLAEVMDGGASPRAYAVPLVADDRLMGVLELVSRSHADAGVILQRALLAAGTALGGALARRVAEETAGTERARLEVALAAGHMGVWDWDLTTNRLRWSATLEGMMGVPPGSFGGRVEDYVALIHADDRDWVLESYLLQFEHRGDRHIKLEHRVVRPGGDLRWIEVRGRALQDPTGQLTAMTGVAVDITEAMEREQASRVHRAQLDLAMDVGAIGTWEWDRRRALGRWSESMVEMVGREVDPEAVPAEELVAALHPDDHPLAETMFSAAMAGEDFHARYRVVRADGQWCWLESWGRPLHDVAGEMIGMAGITIQLVTPPPEGAAT